MVNAMWKGGATAITIQGQRVVSTTGIRCIGNSVQLQGVPYSQPYVISAVGDPAALTDAIARDPYLQVYREDAADPDIAVGWDEQVEDKITAPAYDGLLGLSYAQVLPSSRLTAADPAAGPAASSPGARRRRRRVGELGGASASSGSSADAVGPEETTIVTWVPCGSRLTRRPGSAG